MMIAVTEPHGTVAMPVPLIATLPLRQDRAIDVPPVVFMVTVSAPATSSYCVTYPADAGAAATRLTTRAERSARIREGYEAAGTPSRSLVIGMPSSEPRAAGPPGAVNRAAAARRSSPRACAPQSP